VQGREEEEGGEPRKAHAVLRGDARRFLRTSLGKGKIREDLVAPTLGTIEEEPSTRRKMVEKGQLKESTSQAGHRVHELVDRIISQ